MRRFDEYANKYREIGMERRDGILLMTFHTNGGIIQWGVYPQQYYDMCQAFTDIGSDTENRVVLWTGAGDAFSGPSGIGMARPRHTSRDWERSYWKRKRLIMNLLDIEVPMICAVNGPAMRHSEMPLLCDIVLAAENATFQDTSHYFRQVVPGDGTHVVYPLLLGLNRGRYFLLTGQRLSARQALELGLVSEVLPRDKLLPRAWELAEQLAQRPSLVLRYTRVLFTQLIKRQMLDLLGYGLALEGLGGMDSPPGEGSPSR